MWLPEFTALDSGLEGEINGEKITAWSLATVKEEEGREESRSSEKTWGIISVSPILIISIQVCIKKESLGKNFNSLIDFSTVKWNRSEL